jgi:hypothetical protein
VWILWRPDKRPRSSRWNVHNRSYRKPRLFSNINSLREEMLQEIRQCNEFNMRALANLCNEKRAISVEELFPVFCLLVELDQPKVINETTQELHTLFRHRLIVTDKYLNKTQIQCYQETLKPMSKDDKTSQRVQELIFLI